jgi:hypothetical protein
MSGVMGRAVLAMLLLIAGGLGWMAGRLEGRVADGARRLATLEPDASNGAGDEASRLRPLAERVPWSARRYDELRWQRVARRYFLSGDAGVLPPPADGSAADPRIQIVLANLEFQMARRLRTDRQTLLQKLDGVITRYTDVLKNSPGSEDAAYNFELATRARLAVARRARTSPGPESIDQPSDRTPAQPTVHGTRGDAPPQAQMKPFNLITPQQPDERKQLDAGQGPKPVRKG